MIVLDRPLTLGQLVQSAEKEIKTRLAALGGLDALAPAIEIVGEAGVEIRALTAAEEATNGALTFAVAPKYWEAAEAAGAAAVIIPPALAQGTTSVRPVVICPEPRMLFAVMLELVGHRPAALGGEAFFVDRSSVKMGPGVVIGAGAHIGRNVTMGAGVVIGPQAFLEDGVEVGADSLIHPRAVLRWGVRVGQRCQIHSGAVIGDDGFGYTQLPAPTAGRLIHFKNDHLGSVVLEDDVEVGVNSSIDRGLVADTIIGRGTKIDNLVQIGHNCQVGQDCIIVSQVGLGGHTKIGDRAFLLGQVGLGPGVVIGPDAILGGQSGVGSGRIPAGRKLWSGTPARLADDQNQTLALSATLMPKVRRLLQLFKKSSSFQELKDNYFEQTNNKAENKQDQTEV